MNSSLEGDGDWSNWSNKQQVQQATIDEDASLQGADDISVNTYPVISMRGLLNYCIFLGVTPRRREPSNNMSSSRDAPPFDSDDLPERHELRSANLARM